MPSMITSAAPNPWEATTSSWAWLACRTPSAKTYKTTANVHRALGEIHQFQHAARAALRPLVNSANPINTVASRTLTFVYGPEHQRIMQRVQLDNTAPSSMRAGRTYYLNGANNDLGYEKEVTDAGMTEHKHYLSAGGMVFAMQVTRSGTLGNKPAENLQYLHHDHLGSVAVVTDHDGSVTERLAYDPWGKRRFPNGTADKDDSIVGLTIDRGFTMHEHLDEMGLIHMNGRIFDPLIGRFMSADPFIQAPENLQSHNRFAYVMNNPLSLTDPSGYSWLSRFFKKFIKEIVIRVILTIADGYCGGCATAIYSAYNGYKSGGPIGLIASQIPGLNDNPWGRAAVGCVSAAASGGSCGRGALAADAKQWFGDSYVGQMIGGCVAARINGGSCREGAATAYIAAAAGNVAGALIDGYKELTREKTYKDYTNSFLPAPVLACAASAPCAVAAGRTAVTLYRWGVGLLGAAGILVANEAVNPEAGNGKDAAGDGEKSSKPAREKDVPNRAPPGEVIEGERRTREYGKDGQPVRDYDKPHQGHWAPHIHEWPNGKREHPGRDYSPWPR